MPSVTLAVAADAATTSGGLGAGDGPHLPVGTWSGTRYRSALRFQDPAGWDAWTSITKATLTFYISDHAHVGVRNSDIVVSKQTQANLWTKGSGSQNCNSGFSGSNNTQYGDMDPNSTNRKIFSSGSTANAKKSVDVTEMVRDYWSVSSAVLVFVFDQDTSSDYTELWSMEKTGGYNAELVIDYVTASPPSAPSLILPGIAATGVSTLPTFTWNHVDPQGDPQLSAIVQIFDSPGTTLLYTLPVTGAGETVTATVPLAAGTTYRWRCQTTDLTGAGTWSGQRVFTTAPAPTVTVTPARHMEFRNGAPRLVVDWAVTNGEQMSFRVTAPGYDSGTVIGSSHSWNADTLNLTNGTAITVTVVATFTDGQTATDSETWTPRWGLTTHRRDLLAAPNAWQSALVTSTIPPGADLKMQYASDAGITTTPSSGWFDDIASVPLARYVYWRAWFIPSATAGPTLDKVTIIATSGASQGLDKWSTTRGGSVMVPPWAVDTSEYVYGSRSARCAVTGTGPFYLYSLPILLRANRSYILTGLMKSAGNSGAQIMLMDEAGVLLVNGNGENVETDRLIADTLFYTPDRLDVFRYKTPVFQAPGSDITVYVALRAGGTNGARAWFDAVKLEESTVATAWSPGAIGAAIVDAGGVQIDGSKGGIFRYKGIDAAARSVVGGGNSGLLFAGDTELASPADGVLTVDGVPIAYGGFGTVFPVTGLYVGYRFWRTDHRMEFFWDGTRWLSTTLFVAQSNVQSASATFFISQAGTGGSIMRAPFAALPGTDIFVETCLFNPNISTGGSALSASHKWLATFNKVSQGNIPTSIGTFEIASGANTWRQFVAVVNATMGGIYSDFNHIRLDLTVTGTPGALNLTGGLMVTYRMVAT